MWARELAPIAEHMAHGFGQAMAGKYVASTRSRQNATGWLGRR